MSRLLPTPRAAPRGWAALRPRRPHPAWLPFEPIAAATGAATSSAAAPGGEPLIQAGPGGWRLAPGPGAPSGAASASPAAPLLLVDGTNLAVRCQRGPPGDARGPAGRFAAWLAFLRAATSALGAAVAFDNKGSVDGNARAALHPGYNRARYGPAGGRQGRPESGSA
jgi:hypothetical protein